MGGSLRRVHSSTPPSCDATSLAAASTVALDPGIRKQEASSMVPEEDPPPLEKGEETEAEKGLKGGEFPLLLLLRPAAAAAPPGPKAHTSSVLSASPSAALPPPGASDLARAALRARAYPGLQAVTLGHTSSLSPSRE